MKTGTVYGLLCPIEKRVLYVGQTIKPLSKRLAEHKSSIICSFKNSKKNQWLRSLKEQGLLDSVLIVCLQDSVRIERLSKMECKWIKKMCEYGELTNTVYMPRVPLEVRQPRAKRRESSKLELRRRPDFANWINKSKAA